MKLRWGRTSTEIAEEAAKAALEREIQCTPLTYAMCPNPECRSDLSGTVRQVESVTTEAVPVVVARGTLRVCFECGEMYVAAAGRVFRYHASNRIQVVQGGQQRTGTGAMPQPVRVPNLSNDEP